MRPKSRSGAAWISFEAPEECIGYGYERNSSPATWQIEASRGMEKWKAHNDSHIPTAPDYDDGKIYSPTN